MPGVSTTDAFESFSDAIATTAATGSTSTVGSWT